MSRIASMAAIAAALSLGGSPAAFAHAYLDHASPAVGSTVHGSPGEVRIWYSEELEPAFSTVKVLDQSGAQVDKGDKQLDGSDKTVLKVSLKPLPAGTYQVIWRVLSVDSHVTEGKFKFTVAP